MNSVGSRIRARRETLGLTQKALAERLYTKRETVNQWENGTRQVKGESVAQLADILDTTCDYLLCRTDVATTDVNARAVYDYVGISPAAADWLHAIKESPLLAGFGAQRQADAVNALLNYKSGRVILELIGTYLHFDYDAFRRDGNVFENIALIRSDDPDGIGGMVVRPETVRSALLSEITTELFALSQEVENG